MYGFVKMQNTISMAAVAIPFAVSAAHLPDRAGPPQARSAQR